jgi:hypothetical protein
VRNRYLRFSVCIAFVLGSAFSLLAQSDAVNVQRQGNVQLGGDPTQSVLSAKLGESPTIDSGSNGSELPDAPSTAKPEASVGEAAPSPAVRKEESQGAPPAAMGGPLWIDRGVTDRHYLLLTGGMFGASVANAELTLRCLGKHPACNDVPRSFDSRTALYGIGIPADLGVAYLTYTMKRKHNHMWYVPAALVTGANLFFAWRAYHWTQQ